MAPSSVRLSVPLCPPIGPVHIWSGPKEFNDQIHRQKLHSRNEPSSSGAGVNESSSPNYYSRRLPPKRRIPTFSALAPTPVERIPSDRLNEEAAKQPRHNLMTDPLVDRRRNVTGDKLRRRLTMEHDNVYRHIFCTLEASSMRYSLVLPPLIKTSLVRN